MTRKCPECSSGDVAEIVYEYMHIDKRLQKELDDGRISLGGCCIGPSDPRWRCNACLHSWGKRPD